jgi:hypothetical protein
VRGDVIGGGTVDFPNTVNGFASSDGNPMGFNDDGDFVGRPSFPTATPGACIVRGHVGSLQGTPTAVPVAGGVPHFFSLDCGPACGGQFYLVLATSMGTRPGFSSPFGPQTIPLNFDTLWTQLSMEAANSPLWFNSLGFTDAQGKGIGVSGFMMPPGFPGLIGTTVHHAALIVDFSLTSTFVTEPVPLHLY